MLTNTKSNNIWITIKNQHLEVKKEKIILRNIMYIKSSLLSKNNNPKEFILTNSKLFYIKDSICKKYIDLKFIKIKFNINELIITFTNENNYFNLYCKDIIIFSNWVKELKNLCIQVDFDKNFKILYKIGMGNSSSVFKAINTINKKYYAVKYLKKKENTVKDILNEIKIMKKLKGHPNIIELKEVYENDNSFFLVMEFAHHNNLYKFLNNKTENKMEGIIKSILNGLNHIHNNKILHRDLKPENIFIFKDKYNNIIPKIGDFGASINLNSNRSFEKIGTLGYVDPYILKTNTINIEYRIENDIYSWGALIYFIYFKNYIFDFTDLDELEYKNKNNEFNLVNEFLYLDEKLQNLITSCFKFPLKNRTTIDEFLFYFN